MYYCSIKTSSTTHLFQSLGAVYVYMTADSGYTWSAAQQLAASDGGSGDWLGLTVAVHNGTIVAGALYNDNENGIEAGNR